MAAQFIKSIQAMPQGGYRVAFRLNAQAIQPSCWSPVYGTLEELYQAHPELQPLEEIPTAPPSPAPEQQLVEQAEAADDVEAPSPKRRRKGADV